MSVNQRENEMLYLFSFCDLQCCHDIFMSKVQVHQITRGRSSLVPRHFLVNNLTQVQIHSLSVGGRSISPLSRTRSAIGPREQSPRQRAEVIRYGFEYIRKTAHLHARSCMEMAELKPTLRKLSELPVVDCWYRLGIQLGVTEDDLDAIEQNYPRDTKLCRSKMFGTWLRSDTSATYEKLIKALVVVDKPSLAEKLRRKYGVTENVIEQAKSKLEDASQDCITIYATFLKDKYQGLSVFPDSEWPPSVGDQYIRLALIQHTNRVPNEESIREMREDLLRGKVDKVEGHKKAVDIPGIFAGPEQGTKLRVLVDGAPGVGKTTLCRKVTKDWGCGGFLSEYKLVVLLHLRDRRIAKATKIEDFFYHDDPELQAEVVRQVRKTSGAGVLLIFDGFDELSEEERMDRSLFLDIIKGEVLSQCSVLVTSRPYASESLQCLHSVVRHVEVLGFTKKQVCECITTVIKDEPKAAELLSVLNQRIDISLLCYIPLNCAILLYVYQQLDYTLPPTLTKLFEIFILNTLKRDAKLQSEHSIAKRIRDLISLPPQFSSDLDHLCMLAFNGLVKDKMVFQFEEIEESRLLGLMTAFKSFSSIGDNISYQFLHLTIQEFLAARWVATHMSPQEQATFFKEHFSDDRFRMMLLFLSGITKLDDSSFGKVFSAEVDFLIPEEERRRRIETEELFFRLVHLLYESQNASHCHTLACAINEQTIVLNSNVSPFLFLAFAFFLRRSNCTWKRLDFGTNTIRNEQLDILCQQLEKEVPSLSSTSVSVQQLHVTDGLRVFSGVFPVTMKTLSRIIGIPAFKQLEKLEIIGSPLLYGTNQERNSIPLSSSDLESLRCLMRNGALEELTLLGVPGVDDKVVEWIGQELAVSITLKVLDIGSVTFSSSGLCSIFHALQRNNSLETLHVQKYMCGNLRGLGLAVESALRENQTLKVLSFMGNAQMPAHLLGVNAQKLYGGMFKGLASNTTLKSLTIADNNFVASEEVVSSLIEMLHNNNSLTSLSIIVNYLPSNLLDVLAVGLLQNSSLTRLCVKSRFTTLEPSLTLLAYALAWNSSLKTLVLNLQFDCVLRAENFLFLLGMLVVNKSLTSISFMYHFTDDQLRAIARYLVLNGHRREVELEFEHPYSYSMQEHYESVIQEEVDKFRRYLFNLLCFVYHVYEIYHRPL